MIFMVLDPFYLQLEFFQNGDKYRKQCVKSAFIWRIRLSIYARIYEYLQQYLKVEIFLLKLNFTFGSLKLQTLPLGH